MHTILIDWWPVEICVNTMVVAARSLVVGVFVAMLLRVAYFVRDCVPMLLRAPLATHGGSGREIRVVRQLALTLMVEVATAHGRSLA